MAHQLYQMSLVKLMLHSDFTFNLFSVIPRLDAMVTKVAIKHEVIPAMHYCFIFLASIYD